MKRFFTLIFTTLLLSACTQTATLSTPAPTAPMPTETAVATPLITFLTPAPETPSPVSTPPPIPTPDITKLKKAVVTTSHGKFTITLSDKAPKTVANFKELVAAKFYDGLTWHRVEAGFVVQTGDPTATGSGGSDETILLEIPCIGGKKIEGDIAPVTCNPALEHTYGAVGMARSALPNSASSQFYITLDVTPDLDRRYAVFGYVTSGMEVVEKIRRTDVITSITLE